MGRRVCLQLVAENVHQAAPHVTAAEQLDAFCDSREVGMLPLPANVDRIVQFPLSHRALRSRVTLALTSPCGTRETPFGAAANRSGMCGASAVSASQPARLGYPNGFDARRLLPGTAFADLF